MSDDRGPMPLADSLARWRRLVGVAAPDTMARVGELWPQVAGDLAGEVEPASLRDDILVVTVREPAVAEAVRWRAEAWVGQLQALLGGGHVARIDVRQQRPGRPT